MRNSNRLPGHAVGSLYVLGFALSFGAALLTMKKILPWQTRRYSGSRMGVSIF